MRNRFIVRTRLGAAASLAALLVACGGGGGTQEMPAPTQSTGQELPPSAGTSTASFVAFQKGMAQSDTAEPIELHGFKPPTSDTDEPSPVR